MAYPSMTMLSHISCRCVVEGVQAKPPSIAIIYPPLSCKQRPWYQVGHSDKHMRQSANSISHIELTRLTAAAYNPEPSLNPSCITQLDLLMTQYRAECDSISHRNASAWPQPQVPVTRLLSEPSAKPHIEALLARHPSIAGRCWVANNV